MNFENHTDIFTKIYETNEWGNNGNQEYKGSSGGGSKIDFNLIYISKIREFIDINNIKKIVEIGNLLF